MFTIVNLDTKQVLSESLTGWTNKWLLDSAEFDSFESAERCAKGRIEARTKTFTGHYGCEPVNYKVIPFSIVREYVN